MELFKRKTSLKVFVATAITLFSLASSFIGTFAWFSANTNVSATGMTIIAYTTDVTIACTVYKYNARYESPTASSNYTQDFSLNQYDIVFKERNRFNPLYLKIQMAGVEVPTTAQTFSLAIERNTDLDAMDENNRLASYFSSVTKYAVATDSEYTGGIYDKYSVQNTWDHLNTVFASKTTTTFTSGTSGNYTKVDALNLTINYSANDFVDDLLVVYLCVNYDADLAEAYSAEHNFGTDSIDNTGTHSLDNDLKAIRVLGV